MAHHTWIWRGVKRLAAVCLMAGGLRANVLVNVNFDDGYVAGSLVGQVGAADLGLAGTFSAGATTASATVGNVAGGGGLSYQVSGGGLIAGGTHSVRVAGAYGVSQNVFNRPLASGLVGHTLYVRMVVRPEGTISPNTYFRFFMTPSAPATNSAGGTGGFSIGLRDVGGSVPGAQALMNNGTTSYTANSLAANLQADVPNLLVGRFHWNASTGKYDSVAVWVNPEASSEPVPLGTAALVEFVPTAPAAMGVGIVNFATGQTVSLDSIAVGTQWEDVVPAAPGGQTVFKDSFDNNSPADSDAETGTWQLLNPLNSTMAESGGRLVQTATSTDASSVAATAYTAPLQKFNFFDTPLRFSARMTVGPTNISDTTTRGARFILASGGHSSFNAADSLSLCYFVENVIKLNTKVDHADTDANTLTTGVAALVSTASTNNWISFPYYNYSHDFQLTLDAKRFRLVSNITSNGAIRARFSGEHGLQRSTWGANGDSSIMLETLRKGAAAGTVATATWDEVRVDTSREPLLNEPFWDMTVTLTNSSGLTGDTLMRLWVPTTEPIIRGLIIIGPGTGLDYRSMVHDPMVQEAARAIGFGVLAYSTEGDTKYGENLWGTSALAQSSMQTVLNQAASISGHPELANALLCYTGFSLGGKDAVSAAIRLPNRTVAYVAHHYGASVPTAPDAASLKVPGLFVAGSLDDLMGNVKVFFDGWRAKGAQVAFVMDWRTDHSLVNNQAWEATWTWLVETVNLRYPRPLAPQITPGVIPQMVNIPDSSGWLGEVVTVPPASTPTAFVAAPFITVAPYADYASNAATASWFPNETIARMCRALTSTDLVSRSTVPLQSPLRIASPAQYGNEQILGDEMEIVVDPREFDDTAAIASMSFYDGDTLIGTDAEGPYWSLSYTPAAAGLHTLTVVATDTAGAKSSAMRAVFVVPSHYAPLTTPQTVSMTAGASYSGAVSGTDPEGGTVAYVVTGNPVCGLLQLNAATGAYVYRPAHGYVGPDEFSFQAVSAGADSATTAVTLQVSPPVDADGDGMPDAWELLHGVSLPDADTDGDGITNLQEYLTLTDPKDSGDWIHVGTLSRDDATGAVTLQWDARGGVCYRVQYSDDLLTFHDIVRPIAEEMQPGEYGEAGHATFTDDFTRTPATTTKRFYRLRTWVPSE